MKKQYRITILFLAISLFFACQQENSFNQNTTTSDKEKSVKYIFLFIGDGMSFTHVNLAKAAYYHKDFRLYKKPNFGNEKMNIMQLPVVGTAMTNASNRYITESAAAATALATGEKTSCGTVSMTEDHSRNLKTIAEMAREKGMRVGIVSSVNIDHATPACFYAHQKDRSNYNEIASQMTVSNFDYFGGGFARGALAEYMKDDKAKDIIDIMKSAGYKIATTREELNSIVPGQKCWAYNEEYDDYSALYYEIDQPENYIGLAEYTEKGIELLDNPRGFFMMVESGKIDWACHSNDAVTAIHEVVALDESLGKALEFYQKHPDETLIIVTGDHESGGLALGYSITEYESAYELLNYQKISNEQFYYKVIDWKKNNNITQTMILDSVKYYFGLGNTELNEKLKLSENETKRIIEAYGYSFKNKEKLDKDELFVKYGWYDPLTIAITHILNQKAGIAWTTYSHTAVPVPIYTIGPGAENFGGQLDNTDIPKHIMKLAKIN